LAKVLSKRSVFYPCDPGGTRTRDLGLDKAARKRIWLNSQIALFTPQLQKLVYVDFRQSTYYFRQLFDMIWRLYNLPFDNPLLEELLASMTPQKM